jgi:hypothetical protein
MGDRLADAVIAGREAGGAPGGDQRAPFREAFDDRDHHVEQKFFVGRAGVIGKRTALASAEGGMVTNGKRCRGASGFAKMVTTEIRDLRREIPT